MGIMRSHRLVGYMGLVSMSLAIGCGHAPLKKATDPKLLLQLACEPGANIQSVTGSAWLKAHSKEASGQFPAQIEAPSPDRLKMEITNLLGGTEAVITVEGGHYSIVVPNHAERTEKGADSWGGIPLRWANALFLGRIPCPASQGAKLSLGAPSSEADELIVEVPRTLGRMAEKFIYRFRSVQGQPWPEALHWERAGMGGASPLVVDFKFEDPEEKTRSPKKWEAKGSQGEVKVRWRDRQPQMAR